ncbi:hypothetical protein PENARI_c006G08029 [Penicillium arizonense]|uniref:Major facilitator superfamily (MFS) profile domain-containing protein n=1 Tax=Penicillium arizonense TaxID=1835702 RepID=A0A1F5LLZ8_PENAI|nr:hypothetical protein PENARI_c006G08029 [Penicillium arizonense]OGE54233.1 hypothetical protein PENARI_c006G08029 [Penicillium arizonense]
MAQDDTEDARGVSTAVDMEMTMTNDDPKLLKQAPDADEAMKAFEEMQGEAIELDEATNRRLVQTTLSYASIMGLKEDLHLVDDQYQWLGSLFYFGYIAWEYPTNRLLQRLPLGKYSAACIIIWGLILSCFAAAKNYPGAIAIRFFLGVFEAAVTPGFALLTSQWYTRTEQGKRVNIWYSFNGWGQIIGGLVAYGIATGARKHGSLIAPWKIVFLFTGLLTIVLGLVFLWVVPDSQLNARWLKKQDRVLAIARVRINQQGIGNKHFKWSFYWEFGLTNVTLVVGKITSFDYTPEQSLLYGTPAGAVEVVALLLNGYMGDRTGQRILCSLGGLLTATIGVVLIVALPLENNIGRLIGYYMTQAFPTSFVALLSLISSNVAGYTKKTTVAALYLIGYCAGNIIGPLTFRPQDAPRYISAEIIIICCWGVSLLILLYIWWWYNKENRRKAAIVSRADYVRVENRE